ncbi:hypothetical protein EKH55_1102 [Sinorhizobium alkalisoli]|nr:hypothetical protein EKH55_1102 [Sinorhizobium alkalisoli]
MRALYPCRVARFFGRAKVTVTPCVCASSFPTIGSDVWANALWFFVFMHVVAWLTTSSCSAG